MDNSIHDYEESLKYLERQKEQLELVMQTMGEEWEKSGPGINWLKILQNIKHNPTNDNTTATALTTSTTATEGITVDVEEDLTPDASLETDDDLIDMLRQQPQRPSPEHLQSLLHVNETLLAQSLSASPMMTMATATPTIDRDSDLLSNNMMTFASPQTESSLSDVCTPSLNSASSFTQSSTPTTPDDENDKEILHLTKRQVNALDAEDTSADPIAPVTLCPPDTSLNGQQ